LSALRRRHLILAAIGVCTAIVSMNVAISYDEGIWLVDARRWSAGESLYSDIPENRTPALLALVRALDAAPGPYTTARGLYMGAIIVVIAAAARSITARLGWSEPRAAILGLLVGVAAAAQAVLVVNFEVPAATLIMLGLAAIASGRGIAGGALAAAGTGFDVRAFVLLPGVLLFAHAVGGRQRLLRASATVAVLSGAWALTVLLQPDLRFGLLEVNAATRAATTSWAPLDQIYTILRGLAFPLAGVLALSRSKPRTVEGGLPRAWIVLIAAGAVISIASLQPFEKYWSLVLPGIVVLAACRMPRADHRVTDRWTQVAALGLGLAIAYGTVSSLDQARLVDRYERASRTIDASMPAAATFARFDTQPFLGVFLPERDVTPVAVLDFVVAATSRQDQILSRFEVAIRGAGALIDDGALSVDERSVDPPYRELWRVFDRYRSQFPCVRRFGGLTVRYRESACPAATPSG
jgi:hypothetical protein